MGGDALFEMANYTPDETGLPYGVFVSHRGRDADRIRHGPRVKVYPEGFDVKASEIVVMVEEAPQVMQCPSKPHIPARNLRRIARWVRLNREVLRAYWDDNDMSTRQLDASLRRVE
jgi:hypothetical protein